MLSLRCHGAREHGGRGAAAETIAAMRALVIVEAQKAIERSLQVPQAGEVVASKFNPPVFMKNRSLQAFHEPVGPRMPRLRPRVSDPKSCWRREVDLSRQVHDGRDDDEEPDGTNEQGVVLISQQDVEIPVQNRRNGSDDGRSRGALEHNRGV